MCIRGNVIKEVYKILQMKYAFAGSFFYIIVDDLTH